MKQIGTPFNSTFKALGITTFLGGITGWMCTLAREELTNENPDHTTVLATVGLSAITLLAAYNTTAYLLGDVPPAGDVPSEHE